MFTYLNVYKVNSFFILTTDLLIAYVYQFKMDWTYFPVCACTKIKYLFKDINKLLIQS